MHTNLEGADFTGSHSFYIDVRENKTAKATFSTYEALNLLRVLDIRQVLTLFRKYVFAGYFHSPYPF